MRDHCDATGSLLFVLDDRGGVFFVFGNVVVALEDVAFEGREMFDGGVGHEGGANVGGHHHDGGAGAVACHLAFGRHGSVLAEAHGSV